MEWIHCDWKWPLRVECWRVLSGKNTGNVRVTGQDVPFSPRCVWSISSSSQSSEDVEAVLRCIRRQEVRDCVRCSSRAEKELDGPLGETLFFYVAIFTWTRFIDVLGLPYEYQRFFGPRGAAGKLRGLGIGWECEIVVVPVFEIVGSAFRMAPDPVLEDVVPHETTPGMYEGGVCSYEIGVHGVRVFVGTQSHFPRLEAPVSLFHGAVALWPKGFRHPSQRGFPLLNEDCVELFVGFGAEFGLRGGRVWVLRALRRTKPRRGQVDRGSLFVLVGDFTRFEVRFWRLAVGPVRLTSFDAVHKSLFLTVSHASGETIFITGTSPTGRTSGSSAPSAQVPDWDVGGIAEDGGRDRSQRPSTSQDIMQKNDTASPFYACCRLARFSGPIPHSGRYGNAKGAWIERGDRDEKRFCYVQTTMDPQNR